MRENLFQKVLRLEKNFAVAYVHKGIVSTHRKRKIIPDEYFIDVITTVPERKTMVENINI